MPVARFDWSTIARGAKVIPVLLLAGMPYIFTPAGSAVTTLTLPGTLDSRWWPGTGATHASKIRPWLDAETGIAWTERLEPLSDQQVQVSSLSLRILDFALAATVAFASQDSLTRTAITAEVSPTDTTINVVDTSAFDTSGTIYLNREAIDYSGVTGTSFTGCTRARLGSRAQRHPFGTRGGEVLGSPDVTPAPQDVDGRLATLWLATLSADGTTITAVELEYCGVVGQGAQIDGGAFVLDIDPAIKALSQKLPTRTVTVGGYVHAGNNGRIIRNPTAAPPGGGYGIAGLTTTCPLTLLIGNTTTAGLIDRVVLLGDDTTSGDPDNGGWHPDAESFLADWSAAATDVAALIGASNHIYASVDPSTRRLAVRCEFSSARDFSVYWPWSGAPGIADASTAPIPATSSVPMPEAWVPIRAASPVYLTADDYGVVPAVPAGLATGVEALWALKLRHDFEGAPRDAIYYAGITAKTSGSGVYYLTVRHVPTGAPVGSTVYADPVVRTVQDASLSLYVRAPTWVDALYALVVSVSSDLAETMPDAVDWDDLATVRAANPGVFPVFRERVWDVNNILAEFANEARLNGLCLAVRRGLLTMVRAGEYAPTETTVATLTTTDLLDRDATPQVERGAGGIANTFELTDPTRNATFRAVDKTSLAHFGAGQTIKATLPPGVATTPLPATAQAAYQLGALLLAPHRRPVQTVSVGCTLAMAGVQLGDLVDLTLWLVPDRAGARGISSRIGQVVGRGPRLYESGEGSVALTFRLQPTNLQGYAPSALVAAGGISGADVTLDTTTFGTRGCASPLTSTGAVRTDGGASTFTVGDKVRLVELDNTSPTASTQHTVTAVTPASAKVSLNPSPSATFGTLAAAAVKVALVYDDYATSTTAQREYAYLADNAWTLPGGVRARVFGA